MTVGSFDLLNFLPAVGLSADRPGRMSGGAYRTVGIGGRGRDSARPVRRRPI